MWIAELPETVDMVERGCAEEKKQADLWIERSQEMHHHAVGSATSCLLDHIQRKKETQVWKVISLPLSFAELLRKYCIILGLNM